MLVDKFDEGIVLMFWDDWKAHHPRTSHYVTELSMPQNHQSPLGRCIREQWYNWMEVKPSDVNPTRVLFPIVGKLLHEGLFAKAWKRAGVEFVDEVPLEVIEKDLKWPIHGKMDFRMQLMGDRAVEVKTTQGRGITSKSTASSILVRR